MPTLLSSAPLLAIAPFLLPLACATPSPPAPAPAPASEPAPASTAAAPDAADRIAALDEWLERKRSEQQIPGLAAAVVVDGEVVLLEAYGQADLKTGRPVDRHSLFALGSCTKTFTSVLGAMAVEAGAASWDDPVAKHLPGFSVGLKDAPPDTRVTLQDVFSHRTGVGRLAKLWADGGTTLEEVLAALPDQEAIKPYRKSWEYSNVMYAAGGAAIARSLGDDWHALIQQRIFDPLGMQETHTWQAESRDDPARVQGHDKTASGHREMPWLDRQGIAPAGAIDSTITDMARWVQLLAGGGEVDGKRLVAREQLERLWKSQVELGPGVGYGTGWFVREENGRRMVDHPGNGDHGCFCNIVLLPDQRRGFVLLGNVKQALLQHEARKGVFAILDGEEPPVMKGG